MTNDDEGSQVRTKAPEKYTLRQLLEVLGYRLEESGDDVSIFGETGESVFSGTLTEAVEWMETK